MPDFNGPRAFEMDGEITVAHNSALCRHCSIELFTGADDFDQVRPRPSSECRFGTVPCGAIKKAAALVGNHVCGHRGGRSDRRRGGLCCGQNATI